MCFHPGSAAQARGQHLMSKGLPLLLDGGQVSAKIHFLVANQENIYIRLGVPTFLEGILEPGLFLKTAVVWRYMKSRRPEPPIYYNEHLFCVHNE